MNNNDNNDLEKNNFITSILNSMIPYLDNDQLSKLRDNLYINLHDITLTKNVYDVAVIEDNSDAMMIEYFIASKKISGRQDSSIQQYTRAVWNLRNYVNKNFKDITQADIKFYLAMQQKTKNWSGGYLKTIINYLNSFFSLLVKEGMLEKNPMDSIEQIKTEQVLPKAFTPEELEKIRNVCYKDTRNIAMVEFLIATGVRVSELCSIKWKDIDIAANRITVTGKGKKDRNVFFSDKTKYYLDQYWNYRIEKEHRTRAEMLERPLFVGAKRDKITKDYEQIKPGGIRHVLGKIAEDAQISEVHPHKFRRTFATIALNRGMPLAEIKELLGHSNYDTTLLYAKLTNNRIESSYKTYCG